MEDRLDDETLAPGINSPVWRKSTRSMGNGQCVEAAQLLDGRLALRDSMDKGGPIIVFRREAWQRLIETVKGGKAITM
jgi:hypothetical protein